MEVVIGIVIGGLFGVAGIGIYRNAIEPKGKAPRQSCMVYLLRVDPSGKVEIKNAPIQLWTWKY